MTDSLPVIILVAPLFGALLVGLFGVKNPNTCFPIALISLTISLVSAIFCAQQVFTSGPINYFVGGWETGKIINGVTIPEGFGIQLRIDYLNAFFLVVIAIALLCVSFFSIRYEGEKDTEKTHYFYLLFLMLSVGLFGMTVTDDAFNLFVLIEVSSIASYGLIAMGNSPRGTLAAFNYIIMGTIGASFYLLGVGYLYMQTGTLNMDAIHQIMQLPNVDGTAIFASRSILVAFILILVGTWVKMAFFPLHGWLPNAYSFGPSSTSCALAPLMTKVFIYVMIRIMITVFGLDWAFQVFQGGNLIVWLSVIAIVAGSLFALAQGNLRKMLCYLIVAEVGYMVGGAWLADSERWGMTGSIFHILADALMTLCLFLAAGIFNKRAGLTEIKDLEGLFKKMPLTMAAFVIGALSMIGIPPTCGFFSKFYLIRGAMESGHWEYVVALLFSSLVNAVLFFRIIEVAYFGKEPATGHGHDHEEQAHDEIHPQPSGEPPLTQLAPIWVAAILIITLGLMSGKVVEFIRKTPALLPEVAAKVE